MEFRYRYPSGTIVDFGRDEHGNLRAIDYHVDAGPIGPVGRMDPAEPIDEPRVPEWIRRARANALPAVDHTGRMVVR